MSGLEIVMTLAHHLPKVFDPEISLGAVAGIYENFWSSHYRDGKFDFRNKYGSFHYGLNQIISLIDAKFAPMRVGYIWNNIIKTGKAKGSKRPSSAIYDKRTEIL